MKITLKLFALLDKYLPDGAVKNQVEMTVDDGATVMDVIHSVKLPSEYCHLVLIDGVYIAPSERETRVLNEGEALAIWPPVAGG
ncbi:MoaD/ThiS family protein [Magnetovibrio sp.]|uniref:sulfur carrier protein ThiS n=1 Tax=Magnetovibrio sp. TaxID=2024836 RepID=UPI002F9295BE